MDCPARPVDATHRWLALTPPELVKARLKLDTQTIAAFHKQEFPVVPE
jgi:oxalate decarboxylase